VNPLGLTALICSVMLLRWLVLTLDQPCYAVAIGHSPLNEGPKQLIPVNQFQLLQIFAALLCFLGPCIALRFSHQPEPEPQDAETQRQAHNEHNSSLGVHGSLFGFNHFLTRLSQLLPGSLDAAASDEGVLSHF
jgi:hypothetical protein